MSGKKDSKQDVFCTMLSREQIDFLDKITKDAHDAGGKHLSRAEVIRALLRSGKVEGFTADVLKGGTLVRKD